MGSRSFIGEVVQENKTVAVNPDQGDSHRTDSDHTFVPGDVSIMPSKKEQPIHFPNGSEAELTTKEDPHIFTSCEEIEQSDEDYDSSEMVVLRNRFSMQSLKSDFKVCNSKYSNNVCLICNQQVNGKTTDMVKNAAEMVEDMTDQVMSQTIIFCFILFIYTGP